MRHIIVVVILAISSLIVASLSSRKVPVYAQDQVFDFGEHDFQINAKEWTKLKLPETYFYYVLNSPNVIRIKFDDGQEYQILPEPREFRQSKGKKIVTRYMKVSKGKLIPIERLNTMPSNILYTRAESGITSVHISLTRPSDRPESPQSEKERRLNQEAAFVIKWVFIAIILGIPVGAIFIALKIRKSGRSKNCPSCSKWWARRVKECNEINRKTFYDTVTRSDLHYNRDGEVSGSTEREEQVLFTKIFYKDLIECKYCRYQWIATHENVVEGTR